MTDSPCLPTSQATARLALAGNPRRRIARPTHPWRPPTPEARAADSVGPYAGPDVDQVLPRITELVAS